MNKEQLKELSTEALTAKEKSIKLFIGVFVAVTSALFFFVFRDYFSGEEFETTSLIIAICSLGGMASLFPELKAIKAEIKERS